MYTGEYYKTFNFVLIVFHSVLQYKKNTSQNMICSSLFFILTCIRREVCFIAKILPQRSSRVWQCGWEHLYYTYTTSLRSNIWKDCIQKVLIIGSLLRLTTKIRLTKRRLLPYNTSQIEQWKKHSNDNNPRRDKNHFALDADVYVIFLLML